MLTLRDMERVCDRLDTRLSDPYLDDEGLVDVATALMLLTDRLEYVVREHRTTRGPRRDLQMAAARLEKAGWYFRRFQEQVGDGSPSEASLQLAVARQHVALALSLTQRSDDTASVA